MLNLGTLIRINQAGDALDTSIRQALRKTSQALLEAYGVTGIDLVSGVTTKTNLGGAFSKFVELGVLKTEEILGEDYIQNAWDTYLAGQRGQSISISQFVDFTRSDSTPLLEYKRTYAKTVKTGIGLFLVSLHCKRAITLPLNFVWPTNRSNGGVTDRASEIVCAESELVAFVRSIRTNRSKEQDQDPAFAAIGYRQKRIEWYASYGVRLLLATGWHVPEDVNLKDLIALRDAEEQDPNLISVQAVHAAFLDSVSRKFGNRCPITKDDWVYNFEKREGGRKDLIGNTIKAIKTVYGPTNPLSGLDGEILAQAAELKPSIAYPERLKALGAIAGREFDLQRHAGYWIELQELYLLKTRRESYKEPKLALGFLNLYLFFYLPHWFRLYPKSTIEFPDTPNKLKGAIFISRLQALDVAMPATLVEFAEIRVKSLDLTNETHYGLLKQIEKFFDFISTRRSELRT